MLFLNLRVSFFDLIKRMWFDNEIFEAQVFLRFQPEMDKKVFRQNNFEMKQRNIGVY